MIAAAAAAYSAFFSLYAFSLPLSPPWCFFFFILLPLSPHCHAFADAMPPLRWWLMIFSIFITPCRRSFFRRCQRFYIVSPRFSPYFRFRHWCRFCLRFSYAFSSPLLSLILVAALAIIFAAFRQLRYFAADAAFRRMIAGQPLPAAMPMPRWYAFIADSHFSGAIFDAASAMLSRHDDCFQLSFSPFAFAIIQHAAAAFRWLFSLFLSSHFSLSLPPLIIAFAYASRFRRHIFAFAIALFFIIAATIDIIAVFSLPLRWYAASWCRSYAAIDAGWLMPCRRCIRCADGWPFSLMPPLIRHIFVFIFFHFAFSRYFYAFDCWLFATLIRFRFCYFRWYCCFSLFHYWLLRHFDCH